MIKQKIIISSTYHERACVYLHTFSKFPWVGISNNNIHFLFLSLSLSLCLFLHLLERSSHSEEMASSSIEEARALHELLEQHERAVCRVFEHEDAAGGDNDDEDARGTNGARAIASAADGVGKKTSKKEKLVQSHKVRKVLDGLQANARKLRRLYEDSDGALRREVASLSSAIAADDAAATRFFYARLRENRDFHTQRRARQAGAVERVTVTPVDTSLGSTALLAGEGEAEDMETENMDVRRKQRRRKKADEAAVAAMFSGEEIMGRCIDVHALHEVFLNASFGSNSGSGGEANNSLSYQDYISTFFGDAKSMRTCVPTNLKLKGPLPAEHRRRGGGGGGGGDAEATMMMDLASSHYSIGAPASVEPASVLEKGATTTYAEYMQRVEAYLVGFIERTKPLMDIDAKLDAAEAICLRQWEEGTAEGWEDFASSSRTVNTTAPATVTPPPECPIDLVAFASAESLLNDMGVEKVSAALREMSFKAGGTPLQRAERLFSVKGVTDISQLDPKVFASKSAGGKRAGFNTAAQATKVGRGGDRAEALQAGPLSQKKKERKEKLAKLIAVLEARVSSVLEMDEIKEAVGATITQIERKQALTYEEMLAEAEAGAMEEEVEYESEEEEEEIIYNPLKLPTGWDGRPIPYWLYKLHGLNKEFKCEICGNATYQGRRDFERHFNEAKHQAGLRALGIPPGKEFHEVTSIQDAKALFKSMVEKKLITEAGKMVTKADGSQWDAADDEEFEDDEGNVYNRKTYEDLKRQGLI